MTDPLRRISEIKAKTGRGDCAPTWMLMEILLYLSPKSICFLYNEKSNLSVAFFKGGYNIKGKSQGSKLGGLP